MIIERIKARVKEVSEVGNEIKPPHKCFCCHDSGLVSEHFDLSQYVEGDSEVRFICTRIACDSGTKYKTAYELSDQSRTAMQFDKKNGEFMGSFLSRDKYQANFDDRLQGAWCDQIHRDGYYLWQESIKQKVTTKSLEAIGQWN
jgi:hypothetical protein